MKFITATLLTALLAFALGLQLPWYTIAVASFVIAASIPQKAGKTFLSGFLGIALIWTMLCVINIINGATSIATQMAQILPLKGNIYLLVSVTVFIGALVGGLGAISGHYVRKLFSKKR